MAKWIQFQLNGGLAGDKQIVSTAALQQTRTPQIIVPLEGLNAKLFPDVRVMAYGMGWMVHQESSGGLRLEHSGYLPGMSSNVVLLPESKLGLVVLTNSQNVLCEALSNHVVDRFLAKPSRDWSDIFLGVDKLLREIPKNAEKADIEKRVIGTSPSLKPAKYVARYEDEFHGPAIVEVDALEKLTLTFHGLTFDLEHWNYDTFRASERAGVLPKSLVTFSIGGTGAVSGLSFTPHPRVDKLVMTRVPPKAADLKVALDEKQLVRLAGSFESKSPPLDLVIEKRGGELTVVVGGGEPQLLTPVSPTRLLIGKTPPPGTEEFPRIDFEFDGDKGVKCVVTQGPLTIEFLPKVK
ncbi:MAG: DUF3471 domain-containing protein, partial [Planctomycetota bacterium]|nr:DUF3471 domain-containing protein [Planctomycetota bacterium]